jgi:hypothetical protein
MNGRAATSTKNAPPARKRRPRIRRTGLGIGTRCGSGLGKKRYFRNGGGSCPRLRSFRDLYRYASVALARKRAMAMAMTAIQVDDMGL